MERFKIAIVVPAFNEEKTISDVIKDLKKYSDVIVVDDNSSDNTYNLAKKNNVILIKNKKNLGYENTLYVGIIKAIELDYDYAITFDADGEHHASDCTKFIELIQSGYDLVIGNRSHIVRFSEKLGKIIFKNKWGIEDPFCGFKGYNLKKLREFNFFQRYNSVGTDLSLSLIDKKLKFININIKSTKREGNSKFGNIISGNFKIFRSIFLSYIFH